MVSPGGGDDDVAIGWVYVLSNSAMPGLVKVGQSSADPALRSAELFTTGVPSPFLVVYKGLYEDYARLERMVHSELADQRHSTNREFFRVDVKVAIRAIKNLTPSAPKYEEIAEVGRDTSGGITSDPKEAPLQSPAEKPFSMGALERQKRRRARLLANGYVDVRGELHPTCPRCKQVVRVPAGKHLEITCPSCGRSWIAQT